MGYYFHLGYLRNCFRNSKKSFLIPQTISNSLLDWSFQNLSLCMSYLQRCPVYNNAHCFSLLIANSSSSFRALLRFPSTCYVHSCYILGFLSTKPDPLFEDYFILAASTNVHLLVVNGSILKFPPWRSCPPSAGFTLPIRMISPLIIPYAPLSLPAFNPDPIFI